MTKKDIITHDMNGVSVLQRPEDGFFNATVMCKSSGKRINNYLRNQVTEASLKQLEAETRMLALKHSEKQTKGAS